MGDHELPTVAVVLAGGSGVRLGHAVPKQLMKVAGKPIIQHTLEIFERSPSVDEVLVLMAPGYLAEVDDIVTAAGLRKVRKVLEGGATRSETTQIALAVAPEECKILLHDAVRPLLSERVIADCVEALQSYDAVDVAIPSADTIIVVDGNDHIAEIPDRSKMRRGQTPQGFRASILRQAYARAQQDPTFTATDDCGIVAHFLPEVEIYVVAGEEANMKVTHPIDLYLVDKLFQLSTRSIPASSSGAASLRGQTVVVLGGSHGIGKSVADLARQRGAVAIAYSRSATGTHVENGADVEHALRDAHERTGRIDHVVVTAGFLEVGALAEMATTAITESLEVNLLGPINVARAALPYLAETGGQLLLFTSSSYTRGRAGYSLYSATKAAIVNLTQALADEWTSAGVRVNCVNPERTATPMRARAFGEEPAGSLLPADLVAGVTLDVLASDLTGMVVDVRRNSDASPDARPAGHTPVVGVPVHPEAVQAEAVQAEAAGQ
jgi:ribitol-5-phosphate 2-dehydrogenase (NADP+) / D-ribitol-5-phosphate cytidylyltransferase